eukprot:jgi/Ulvmu1/4491/UM002_0217.1
MRDTCVVRRGSGAPSSRGCHASGAACRPCCQTENYALKLKFPKALLQTGRRKDRTMQAGALAPAPYPLATMSQPVYSLATNGAHESRDTMNLLTYCAPMSIHPRTVALGLYKGTQSWINFLDSKTGVLQVLRREQLPAFEILGKTSAKDSDKFTMLKDGDWGVKHEFGHRVLEGCHGYLLLECIGGPVDAGDHDVVICKVTEYAQDADSDSQLLYTAHLRESGLL